MNRSTRAPPPCAMDKGTVRRVHQSDNGVIDCSGETDAFDEIGVSFGKSVEVRDFGRAGRIATEIDPDVALHLTRPIAADMDTARLKRLARRQRGDQRTTAPGVEAPAVIAALDLRSVEAAGAEAHAAMRTEVAQCKSGPRRVAADQDRFAEH